MKISTKNTVKVVKASECKTGQVYNINGKPYLKIIGYSAPFVNHINSYNGGCKTFLDLETCKIILVGVEESATLLSADPEINI